MKIVTLPLCIPFPASLPIWAQSMDAIARTLTIPGGADYLAERYISRVTKGKLRSSGCWKAGKIEITEGWEGPIVGIATLS